MKRSLEALVLAEMIAVIVGMAILGLAGIASAEPVQQLSVGLSGQRPGEVVLHLTVRRFDTTGLVPPTPSAFELRLPAGVRIDPAFLTARYECDAGALRDALDARQSGTPFVARLDHLGAFVHELARSHAKRDRAVLPNARACARGRLGGGTGLIDARNAIRVLTDPIPFRFAVFLTRGTIPGAIAGLAGIGAADPGSAIARRYPVIAGVHAIEQENVVSDPSPDGAYGLKVVFYTGPLNGFDVSRAKIDATVHSLTLREGTCAARGRGGRCVRRQRHDATLFELPRCPPSGRLSALAFTAFPPPTPSQTAMLVVPCPPYTR